MNFLKNLFTSIFPTTADHVLAPLIAAGKKLDAVAVRHADDATNKRATANDLFNQALVHDNEAGRAKTLSSRLSTLISF